MRGHRGVSVPRTPRLVNPITDDEIATGRACPPHVSPADLMRCVGILVADDTTLLAESEAEAQRMVEDLRLWLHFNGGEINITKSKLLVFNFDPEATPPRAPRPTTGSTPTANAPATPTTPDDEMATDTPATPARLLTAAGGLKFGNETLPERDSVESLGARWTTYLDNATNAALGRAKFTPDMKPFMLYRVGTSSDHVRRIAGTLASQMLSLDLCSALPRLFIQPAITFGCSMWARFVNSPHVAKPMKTLQRSLTRMVTPIPLTHPMNPPYLCLFEDLKMTPVHTFAEGERIRLLVKYAQLYRGDRPSPNTLSLFITAAIRDRSTLVKGTPLALAFQTLDALTRDFPPELLKTIHEAQADNSDDANSSADLPDGEDTAMADAFDPSNIMHLLFRATPRQMRDAARWLRRNDYSANDSAKFYRGLSDGEFDYEYADDATDIRAGAARLTVATGGEAFPRSEPQPHLSHCPSCCLCMRPSDATSLACGTCHAACHRECNNPAYLPTAAAPTAGTWTCPACRTPAAPPTPTRTPHRRPLSTPLRIHALVPFSGPQLKRLRRLPARRALAEWIVRLRAGKGIIGWAPTCPCCEAPTESWAHYVCSCTHPTVAAARGALFAALPHVDSPTTTAPTPSATSTSRPAIANAATARRLLIGAPGERGKPKPWADATLDALSAFIRDIMKLRFEKLYALDTDPTNPLKLHDDCVCPPLPS